MELYDELNEYTQAKQLWLSNLPFIQKGLHGELTLSAYADFLEQAYHHVKHTILLMMTSGAKLIDQHRWLQDYLVKYITEEAGHEQWILNDIEACGRDPDRIKNGEPGLACEIMIAYVYDMINRINPWGFFGMVFVLEGSSIKLATKAATALEKAFDLPNDAFTYLASHGEVDTTHIIFLKELLSKIKAKEDRVAVLEAADKLFTLYGNIFVELGEKHLAENLLTSVEI